MYDLTVFFFFFLGFASNASADYSNGGMPWVFPIDNVLSQFYSSNERYLC